MKKTMCDYCNADIAKRQTVNNDLTLFTPYQEGKHNFCDTRCWEGYKEALVKQKGCLHTDPDTPPEIGDQVYIRTSYYIDDDWRDFTGGLCEVIDTDAKNGWISIRVRENPGTQYGWSGLAKDQERMYEQYGLDRGYLDRDRYK